MSDGSNVALELGEGFADDEVAVLVDGREVWRREGVTTNYSVGIAEVVQLAAPGEGATVEVRVRDLTDSAQVDSSTAGGEIRLRARIDPAGALTVGPRPEQIRF